MSVIYCPDCNQRIIDNVCACNQQSEHGWQTASPGDITGILLDAAAAIGGNHHVMFTEYNVDTGQVIIEIDRPDGAVRWMIEANGNADLLHDQHESE